MRSLIAALAATLFAVPAFAEPPSNAVPYRYSARLVGIEARGHYNFAGDTISALDAYDWNWPYGNTATTYRSTFDERFNGDLILRAGFVPTNWLLVYGKIGAGAREFPTSYRWFADSETSQSDPWCQICRTHSEAAHNGAQYWVPSILIGTGIAANFDRFFVREITATDNRF
jgi:opacity protein-like surface antigen